MNFNTVSVVMFFGGIILVYAAIKNEDPRDVIKKGLGMKGSGKPFSPDLSGAPSATTPPPGTAPGTPPYAWPNNNALPPRQSYWI